VYGSLEFLKFLFIVDFATCISVFVLVYITYAATAWGDILYTQFYGFHGILAGLLVALRQVMQDQDVILFGSIKLGIKVCGRNFLVRLNNSPDLKIMFVSHHCSTSQRS